MTPKLVWEMPAWMEPYRDLLVNTGGHSIEDLMSLDSSEVSGAIDPTLALLCLSVKSQVALLMRLHGAGKLR